MLHSTKLYEVEPTYKGGEVVATLEKAIIVAKFEGKIKQKMQTKPISMTIRLRL